MDAWISSPNCRCSSHDFSFLKTWSGRRSKPSAVVSLLSLHSLSVSIAASVRHSKKTHRSSRRAAAAATVFWHRLCAAASNPRSRSACRSRKSQLSRSLSIVCDLCVTLLDDDSRARPEMDAICIDAIIEYTIVYHWRLEMIGSSTISSIMIFPFDRRCINPWWRLLG